MKFTAWLGTALAVTLTLHTGLSEAFDLGSAIDAASKGVKAATLSDAEVADVARQVSASEDKRNKVAPAGSPYAVRLGKVVAGLQNEDGLKLNFKVYLTPDVNAFAMADGTVRVYSGLMDKMSDDELRFVIGHEIAHVKLGHSKKALQTAYATSAARDAMAASGNTAAVVISQSALGGLAEKLIHAQFSQSQESDADAYSVRFMQKHNYNLTAAASALRKLQDWGGGENSMFSSHPAPGDRASKVETQLKG
ncbi:M48 family metallopeptidase [Curvibacter sp. RS43]|uniref:M48 family metallopeptidase n=1 Tax=Curvibacter microcysteis TaxID=3026419 RepID=UPI00235FAD11|nr:M48 family metallopeptidase [Curvibacter sp. RS43]MDD0811299.1 M48 family metallopeptidase [Curvibacter sp. RS43]